MTYNNNQRNRQQSCISLISRDCLFVLNMSRGSVLTRWHIYHHPKLLKAEEEKLERMYRYLGSHARKVGNLERSTLTDPEFPANEWSLT